MFALFMSQGNSSDWIDRFVKGSQIMSARSIKNRAGMPSNPLAL